LKPYEYTLSCFVVPGVRKYKLRKEIESISPRFTKNFLKH